MKVFISHSTTDLDFTLRLANDLILFDVEVWIDVWSVPPGESIPRAVHNGLRSCDCILVVLSTRAVASRWVDEEIQSTLHSCLSCGSPPIVPIRIDSCELPPMLSHRRCLDFRSEDDYEQGLADLVEHLRSVSGGNLPANPVIPGFRDVRPLGEGGFSTVYKAVDAQTGDLKAIKFPKGKHFLVPEAHVNEALGAHPGIVPVQDVLRYKGRQLLVMPYAGKSLAWHLSHGKVNRMQVAAIVDWMKALLSTLDHAHAHGITHRDIKPSNILIDDYGTLRVTDFGIAQKVEYVEFQRSTVVRGTVCYMSPEQQLAYPATPQSDIYSFGAVFFELLTGEKPVGRYRSPRSYNAQLSFRLNRIIEKCLEREPSERYQTAHAVLEDLESTPRIRGYEFASADFVGVSQHVADLKRMAELAGSTKSPVLLTGETGTGKELIARLVYEAFASRIGDEVPFVAVTVVAMPESVAQAELFGYTKGAFTGAQKASQGLIRAADGGVLYLDEIGDCTPSIQAALLRFLSDGEVRPLGGRESFRVNVKVIAATNRDMEDSLRAGHFRQDLYYRLNGLHIDITPLRERREDILPLFRFFLQEAAEEHWRGQVPEIASDAVEVLESYQWPGNVRELKMCAQHAVLMRETKEGTVIGVDELGPLEIPSRKGRVSRVVTLDEARREAERTAVLSALSSSGGKVGEAARLLGVSPGSFRRLRRRLGL